jgi:hypothetical protein
MRNDSGFRRFHMAAAQEQAVIAAYLRKQARTCLGWSRDCFDLQAAARLRLMADEFNAKAAEIEAHAGDEIDDLEPHPDSRRPARFEMRRNAS